MQSRACVTLDLSKAFSANQDDVEEVDSTLYHMALLCQEDTEAVALQEFIANLASFYKMTPERREALGQQGFAQGIQIDNGAFLMMDEAVGDTPSSEHIVAFVTYYRAPQFVNITHWFVKKTAREQGLGLPMMRSLCSQLLQPATGIFLLHVACDASPELVGFFLTLKFTLSTHSATLKLRSVLKLADNATSLAEAKLADTKLTTLFDGEECASSLKTPEGSFKLYRYASYCRICRANTETFRCTRCRRVYYCSASCQSQDWSQHKLSCK